MGRGRKHKTQKMKMRKRQARKKLRTKAKRKKKSWVIVAQQYLVLVGLDKTRFVRAKSLSWLKVNHCWVSFARDSIKGSSLYFYLIHNSCLHVNWFYRGLRRGCWVIFYTLRWWLSGDVRFRNYSSSPSAGSNRANDEAFESYILYPRRAR